MSSSRFIFSDVPLGWKCPVCSHVYAPSVNECSRCGDTGTVTIGSVWPSACAGCGCEPCIGTGTGCQPTHAPFIVTSSVPAHLSDEAERA